MKKLSLIVPIGPKEKEWIALSRDLSKLSQIFGPDEVEYLFIGTSELSSSDRKKVDLPFVWEVSEQGRAQQINRGLERAQGEWFWILHADTRWGAGVEQALLKILKESAERDLESKAALYYFQLQFLSDGPKAMKVNEWGVRWRSNWLKMPFGDQGFLFSREVFQKLGFFPEGHPYGEDHLYVWKARQKGVPVLGLDGVLQTSARKYAKGGWLPTTLRSMYLTVKQALPPALGWIPKTSKKGFGRERKTGAVVVFVKTPGLSPLKTRLAQGVGFVQAEKFYSLSVQAIESVLVHLSLVHEVETYWAVAESEGMDDPLWGRFRKIEQGSGSLGERLDRVYRKLQGEHRFVLFLGGDSPQISSHLLSQAVHSLQTHQDFVLGPSLDGGYYLFGGRKPLSPQEWTAVPYSTDRTGEVFRKILQSQGSLEVLPSLRDVDEQTDLTGLLEDLQKATALTPEQKTLQAWLEKNWEKRTTDLVASSEVAPRSEKHHPQER